MKRWSLPLVVVSLAALPIRNANKQVYADDKPLPALKAQTTAEGVAISEGDRPVLFYQRTPKSVDGRYERAGYIHPLYDLDGQVLTEDFPKDHLHQRGIYWAWHQIWVGEKRVGDGWAIQNISWDVKDVQVQEQKDDSISLIAHVLWKSPLWKDEQQQLKPLVKETSQITVHRSANDTRRIDFRIELLALERDMKLGGSEDEKGYSGFSVRIRLPEDVRFIGREGDVQPQVSGVAAGPWMDIAASFSGSGPSGLAILCHPSLPGFPQPWVIRSSRSMQNPAWPGREAAPLSNEKPLLFKYRLVLHRGSASRETIDAWQTDWEKQ